MLVDLYNKNNDFFVLRYEDVVDGKLQDLESYLGLKLEGKVEVASRFKVIERTKSKGGWRNWFTQEDVEYFKPRFKKYMTRFGYWDDWRLNEKQVVLPEFASSYFLRLMNDRRARFNAKSKQIKRNKFLQRID